MVCAVLISTHAAGQAPDCENLEDHSLPQEIRDQIYLDDARAVELATVLVGHCPDSAEARRLLGEAYLRTENPQPQRAVEELRKAIALGPNEEDIVFHLAEALGELGRPREQAEVASRLVEIEPETEFYYSYLAGARETVGDVDGAAQVWRLALERGVGLPESWAHLGDLYVRNDRSTDAVPAYRAYLELEPDEAVVWNDLANALEDSDEEAAIEAYLRALELEADEESAYIWTNLALSYVAVGRFEKAIEAAQRSVTLEPEEGVFWYNLGIVLRDAGQLRRAAEALRRSTELKPQFQKARHKLAEVEQRLGNRDAAAADEARAGEMAPSTIPEWQERLAFLRSEGIVNLQPAARQKLTELRAELELTKKRAQTALDAGKTAEALAAAAQGLALHPQDAELLELRRRAFSQHLGTEVRVSDRAPAEIQKAVALQSAGLAAYEAGNLAKAEDLYRQSLEADPGSSTTWYNLGLLYSDQERWEPSAEAYRQAISLEPESAGTWNNLGFTYFYAEKYSDARAAYERAVALRPDYGMAWGNIAEVCQTLEDRPCLENALDQVYRLGREAPKGVTDPRVGEQEP